MLKVPLVGVAIVIVVGLSQSASAGEDGLSWLDRLDWAHTGAAWICKKFYGEENFASPEERNVAKKMCSTVQHPLDWLQMYEPNWWKNNEPKSLRDIEKQMERDRRKRRYEYTRREEIEQYEKKHEAWLREHPKVLKACKESCKGNLSCLCNHCCTIGDTEIDGLFDDPFYSCGTCADPLLKRLGLERDSRSTPLLPRATAE